MDVKKLFNGIAVVIDDDLNKPDSDIANICNNLEKENIALVKCLEIPKNQAIDAYRDCSFMIVDWEFMNKSVNLSDTEKVSDELGGRISIPNTLQESNKLLSLNFLKEVQQKLFLPVFIVTGKSVDEIISVLKGNNLYYEDKPNRIFIEQKSKLTSSRNIFDLFETWVKSIPSVYVLKEWENASSTARHKMFLDMYSCSHSWVNVLWKLMKCDSADYAIDFSSFIKKSHANRVEAIIFDEEIMASGNEPPSEEVKRIIEGERYMSCSDDSSKEAHTGDLFILTNNKNGNSVVEYWLNVTAQCNLARLEDPDMICIKGHELTSGEMLIEPIRLINTGDLIIDPKHKYKIIDALKDDKKIIEINDQFEKSRNKMFISTHNDIRESISQAVVPCICRGKIIVFNLSPFKFKYSELKDFRDGRLLPPYITRVQQKFSHYIVREGVMPVPAAVFI